MMWWCSSYMFLAGSILLLGVAESFSFNGDYHKKQTVKLSEKLLKDLENVSDDLWFTQKLDHFSKKDERVWKQKYLVNSAYYKPGGPAFIYIGGEGPLYSGLVADPLLLVTLHWISIAREVNAMCFMLEHRYYGQSHPTADLSVKNLDWLTSEQALADLANFITAMTKKYELGDVKWVSFGGSYAGSLSAWLRMKYPNLVHAAVSSSAPVVAVANFKEYFEVVKDSLATTSPHCVAVLANATEQLSEVLKNGSKEEMEKLEELFNLAATPDPKNTLDMELFQQNCAGVIASEVQYDHFKRNIEKICNTLDKPAAGDALQHYGSLITLLMRRRLSFSYNGLIDYLQCSRWTDSSYRQWIFQTCNEFGFYQTSDSANQPFKGFPLSFDIKMCTDVFGPQFNLSYINSSVAATNKRYGGRDVRQKRIVFVNGSIDPWHALGIINKTARAPYDVIYINGTSHCADMLNPTPNDPKELTVARRKITCLVKKWLQES